MAILYVHTHLTPPLLKSHISILLFELSVYLSFCKMINFFRKLESVKFKKLTKKMLKCEILVVQEPSITHTSHKTIINIKNIKNKLFKS